MGQQQILDILLWLLHDIEERYTMGHGEEDTIQAFVESVLAQSSFLSRLLATFITANCSDEEKEDTSQYAKAYGDPYKLSSFSSSNIFLLIFYIAYFSSIAPEGKDTFWNFFFAASQENEKDGCIVASFLLLTGMQKEENMQNISMDVDFFHSSRITVLVNLFHGLTHTLLPGRKSYDTKTLQTYPITALAVDLFHTHEELIAPICEFLQAMIKTQEGIILPSLLSTKTTMTEIFKLLSYNGQDIEQTVHIRTFICHLIRMLSEGPYPFLEKVDEYHLTTDAILHLSQVCDILKERLDDGADYFDERSDSYSTIFRDCIYCLVVFLSHRNTKTHLSATETKLDHTFIEDSQEAIILSSKLGALLSNMLLSRFASTVEDPDDSNIDEKKSDNKKLVSQTSEAILLCNLANHSSSLPILVKCGGLDALHLLVTEGLLLPLTTFRKACLEYPEEIVQMDGYRSVMEILIANNNQACDQDIASTGLNCLYILCDKSSNGRKCISNSDLCEEILVLASKVIPSNININLDTTAVIISEEFKSNSNDETSNNVISSDVITMAADPKELVDDLNKTISSDTAETSTEQKEDISTIDPPDNKIDIPDQDSSLGGLESSSNDEKLQLVDNSTISDNRVPDQMKSTDCVVSSFSTSKELLLAAISFLTEIISVEQCLKIMKELDLFLKLVRIVDDDNPYKDDNDIRHAAIRFLSCLALLPSGDDTSTSSNLLFHYFANYCITEH